MEKKEVIDVLKKHNEYRQYRGELDKSPPMVEPKKLGIAINKAIELLEEKNNKWK